MRIVLLCIMALLCAALTSAVECDVSLSISHTFAGSKLLFTNTLTTDQHPYIIEYWIEDTEGNIIKPKRNTTNQHPKEFTPHNQGDIIIKSQIASLDCADKDLSDNYAEKPLSLNQRQEVTINFAVANRKPRFAATAKPSLPSDRKMTGLVPIFLIIVTSLISIVLIWKR